MRRLDCSNRYVITICHEAERTLMKLSELYAPALGQSPLIDTLFLRLRKKVAEELKFQQELVKAQGALEMLLASAALTSVQPASSQE